MKQKPIIHGRDHLPSGADPIPGLTLDEAAGSFTDWVLALPGVWAYWPLQEASGDAIDQGSTHADMQPVGTPAYHSAGPNTVDLTYAVRLTGSPQNTITDDSFYNTADDLSIGSLTDFTAMCWINPDSAATSSWRLPIIGTRDSFRLGWILQILETSRQLTYSSGNGSANDNVIGPAVTMDDWSLVAVTRDAGAINLYVNGAWVADGTGVLAASGHGIRLGAADFATSDPDSYHFYGDMAGAVFVDSPLSGADILAGYVAATGATGIASGTAAAGTVLHADGAGSSYWAMASLGWEDV